MLLKTKLIVWDEAPMTHVHAFLAVDRLLQDLTKCKEPFGTKSFYWVEIFAKFFHDIDFSSVTPQELKGRAILTVNNERSMEINNKVLEFMPGNETVYKAVDMIMSEDSQDQLTFPEEFLNSLTPTGLPPYQLKLKIGCIIMLLRNLAPSKG
ncbi:hypothetical protein AVEN_246769-1 [Araneus ventricosus]|uniref:ATP-dependent DNA helicase n=1 Tax=Araneus ventricosus TaxID=182803 RepID=A0A4Y2QZ89_ARAVE|nr:hypothetical protein AVEN_246769-1 [Araneus ventricosus]